jgi:hypothetical protein
MALLSIQFQVVLTKFHPEVVIPRDIVRPANIPARSNGPYQNSTVSGPCGSISDCSRSAAQRAKAGIMLLRTERVGDDQPGVLSGKSRTAPGAW